MDTFSTSSSPPRRVAFYSHDTQGLGHVRRNIALAAALVAASPRTDVLLLTGAPEATSLPLPPRTEVVTLPTVCKSRNGSYAPAVLDMPFPELTRLRGDLIAAAVGAFGPDLLVVDKVARGLGGELDRTLSAVRRSRGGWGARAGTALGTPPRVVLGLRDVLDDPRTARREWAAQGTTETLLSSYDEVWVYGDPNVYDPAAEYGWPRAVAEMVRYTGYLANGRGDAVSTRFTEPAAAGADPCPYVLGTVGGGQDGARLARAFARATYPAGHRGVLLTGPYMPSLVRDELQGAAAARDDLTVLTFVPSALDLVNGAAATVTMGGYNTVCEALASGRPALVVPRVTPRAEQAVRAERLAAAGLVDVLPADDTTPAALSRWAADAVSRGPARTGADLDGLRRVPALVDELLTPTVAQEVTSVPA